MKYMNLESSVHALLEILHTRVENLSAIQEPEKENELLVLAKRFNFLS